MAKEDLSAVNITNPTSEDFTWNYNGEPYTIKAGATTPFAKPVAFHLAKHLSTQMVVSPLQEGMSKKDIDNKNAPVHVKISQLSIYDTHERRISLYKILKNAQTVVELISRYPFKGFIGEMGEYQKFVEKEEAAVAA